MLFNSIDFAIFLPIVFILYWFVTNKNFKIQNFTIVVVSYIFYGWWDWRFLLLIIFSTLVDYFVALRLLKQENAKSRKIVLLISIIVNLGFLGFFKYYNFFIQNFVSAFTVFGKEMSANTLNIILPVGISFYTFQTLSYTIDVYHKKIQTTKSIIAYAAFVSFFPQLVAGPIERATHLLPQFLTKRTFNYNKGVCGLQQILWGFFKKIVIADNCAKYANLIFSNPTDYTGSTLVIGALFFTFQIYGDFSGYSDIAIGTAKLFGFDLKKNFNFPYFSTNIAEFWRRWHISLSAWFKDYVYIPLGGSRGNKWKTIRNVFIVFILSGLWHGANWTFIVWGALNALFYLPLLFINKHKQNIENKKIRKAPTRAKTIFKMLLTFSLTVFAWIFFRAESVPHALSYIYQIFSATLFSVPNFAGWSQVIPIMILIKIFIITEWYGRNSEFAIANLSKLWPQKLRYVVYYAIAISIIYFSGEPQKFIYFQF